MKNQIFGILLLTGMISFASAGDQCSVSLAYQDRIVDATVVAAVEKGLFAKYGVQVNGSLFKSGPECTEALLQGGANMATMGDAAAVILLASQEKSFEILAAHGGGEHRHRIVALPSINKIQDLQGRRVAVKFGTSTHTGLLKYLAKNHYSWDLIDMAPNLQMTALAAGEVSAIVASEPTPSEAESKGKGKVIADLSGLGNEYPVVLVVNKKWLSQNRDCSSRVIKSLADASAWIASHPDEMAAILAKRSGMKVETAKKSMSLHQYQIKTPAQIQHSLEEIKLFLVKQGLID